MKKRLLWVVPEARGGIRSYADALIPVMAKTAEQCGWDFLEPVYEEARDRAGVVRSLAQIRKSRPDWIHLQHEYGLFGKKLPFLNTFFNWQRGLPAAVQTATFHHVLPPDYRFSVPASGWKNWAKRGGNLGLPYLRSYWGKRTYSAFSKIIVHSARQRPWIAQSGYSGVVETIPHFVFDARPAGIAAEGVAPALGTALAGMSTAQRRKLMVFGFFTPDKGQHLAIQALQYLPADTVLFLVGGVRRPEDQGYLDFCQNEITRLALKARVHITGFVDEAERDRYYALADLVLAPFVETTGSGSLATAFAQGKPVLASDLELNREIAERVPDALGFFRAGDAGDLALQVKVLLADERRRKALVQGAEVYRQAFSIEKTVQAHWKFFATRSGELH